MATGIPKKDNAKLNGKVHLAYKDKISEEELLKIQPPCFDAFNSSTTGKRLYFGDNLDVLRTLLDDKAVCGKISLIYIDPPFATQSRFLSRKQSQAYDDTLSGAAFVEFLRARLILLHKLLSNNGSIYLHLDEKMIFEMKIIMDEIFGSENYRNLIIRKKCNPKNYTRKAYGNIADFILFYTKTRNYIWNKQTVPLSEESQKEYQYVEENTGRRFMKVPVHAPGTRNGETGKPWRGKMPPPGKHWQYTPKLLDEMDVRGEIYWSKNGNPRRKIYLDEHSGVGVQDIWLDFRDAHNQNVKITGYPTEKNPDLLKRIVSASSNPGDLIFDCFAGSGTTLAVADKMQRNWIGVDNSIEAIKTTLNRFEKGLEPMGDFVTPKKVLGKRINSKQQTLFGSLDMDNEHSPSYPNPNHSTIYDFSFFLPQCSPDELRRFSQEWFLRNNASSSRLSNTSNGVEESSYADIIFYLHKEDKKLAKIINEVGPCNLIGNHTGFEFLVDAIISQQLSKLAADSIIKKFKGLFSGKSISACNFLKIIRENVKSSGISDRKYEYIYDLSTKINDKSLILRDLQTESDDVVRYELKKIKGIGDWTVDMYLLFGLARLNVFPQHDLALKKIISSVYKVPQDDINSIIKISKRWEPYKSIGAWYLYRYRNQNT